MTIKFIIHDPHGSPSRYYLAPGDGATDDITKAYRYSADELSEPKDGNIVYGSPQDEGWTFWRTVKASWVQVAPESTMEVLALVKQQEELNRLVEQGRNVLDDSSAFAAMFVGQPEVINKIEELKTHETTTLETGFILQHHLKENCEGPCALHGSSDHPLAGHDRGWSGDKRIIMRRCDCDEWHPDPDDIKVREMPHLRIHACCDGKCCKED